MERQLARQPTSDREVLRSVDRATAELRRGGVLLLDSGAAGCALIQAAEAAQSPDLARMATWSGGATAPMNPLHGAPAATGASGCCTAAGRWPGAHWPSRSSTSQRC